MNRTKRYADRIPSPVGDIWVVIDEAGALVALDFDGGRNAPKDEGELERRADADGVELVWSARALAPVRKALEAYFAGKTTTFDLAVAPQGTPFQREVWEALRSIAYGETISYGELARRVGRPGAARAVGAANGANPISLVIPCHRVIGASG